MTVKMECPCDIIGCQPSKMWSNDTGKFVHCPTLDQDYIHVQDDIWSTYDIVDGCKKVERNESIRDDAANARIIEMLRSRVESSCKDHIGEPLNCASAQDLMDALNEVTAPMLKNKTLESFSVNSNVETWLSMQGVSMARGLWNRLLNRMFGSRIVKIRWWHLLLGYKLETSSYISLEPYLTVYDGDDNTEFYHLIVPNQWSENAKVNSSVCAVIRTPVLNMDLHVKPIQAVRSVNIDFTIKRETEDGAVEKKVPEVDRG